MRNRGVKLCVGFEFEFSRKHFYAMSGAKIYLIYLILISSKLCTQFAYANEPSQCLYEALSVNSLVKCLQRFIVQNKTNIETNWTPDPPTVDQRNAWSNVIEELLGSEENCTEITIPESLSDIYAIEKFTEIQEISYCVLYEKQIVDGHFAKGWGIFMVPHSSNSTKLSMVHISTPHPFTDGSVQDQAANIFHKTSAKSLLISGVSRFASSDKSRCDKRYYSMDGAHDNGTMFHTANLAIMKWQMAKIGCPSESCAFIQFHGKAKTSCKESSIFLSTGLGRSPSSIAFYKNKTLPVQRLKKHLRQTLSRKKLTANSPLEDKSCKLTAGSNIFGRVLNGVDVGHECSSSANSTTATGYFIHVEQSLEARRRQAYSGWAKALLMTF